jgi:hypothetical protein
VEFQFTKRVSPDYALAAGVNFSDADHAAAFFNQPDPDEDLFYALESPSFLAKPISERLKDLAAFAKLVEDAQASQVALGNAPGAEIKP